MSRLVAEEGDRTLSGGCGRAEPPPLAGCVARKGCRSYGRPFDHATELADSERGSPAAHTALPWLACDLMHSGASPRDTVWRGRT